MPEGESAGDCVCHLAFTAVANGLVSPLHMLLSKRDSESYADASMHERQNEMERLFDQTELSQHRTFTPAGRDHGPCLKPATEPSQDLQEFRLDFDDFLVELMSLFDEAQGLQGLGVQPLFQDGVRHEQLGENGK